MSPESVASKEKRTKNVRNKYWNHGALNKLNCSRPSTRSCKDAGKKIAVLESKKKAETVKPHQDEVLQNTIQSPIRVDFQIATEVRQQQKWPQTSKMPHSVDSLSMLESLPMDLLVKILCYLHHDQLRAVFHVCQRVREAVILARQIHFNYATPDRSRQKMLRAKSLVPLEHLPFTCKGNGKGMSMSSPRTPKAPRHGPCPPRLHMTDMRQISAVLFHESTLPRRRIPPPGLPRPVLKAVGSTRVLLHEDELCQAVAHNKLL
ncbi:hypothetical protein Cni_G14638 [Canna indica]|uniref:F-box domain-containing protein n=1 Tax=Canna indica TaxID=4628 RepID=A0AAQ3KCH0_9LILI|nr:hypothetical protein Cni_G14638 [Canna indica]